MRWGPWGLKFEFISIHPLPLPSTFFLSLFSSWGDWTVDYILQSDSTAVKIPKLAVRLVLHLPRLNCESPPKSRFKLPTRQGKVPRYLGITTSLPSTPPPPPPPTAPLHWPQRRHEVPTQNTETSPFGAGPIPRQFPIGGGNPPVRAPPLLRLESPVFSPPTVNRNNCGGSTHLFPTSEIPHPHQTIKQPPVTKTPININIR